MNVYGPAKLIHHLPLIQKIGREPAAPVHIHLIVSDLCNQKCSFCAYRDEDYPSNQLFGIGDGESRNNNPNRMIPEQKVLEILADAHEMGVKAIQFTGGGEPTLHPAFNSFLEFCHDRLDIGIVSNGVRWSDETIRHGRRAMWVRISIDAGTAATYSSIRKVSTRHFDSACETVYKLSGGGAVVGVGFVVTKENWREIVEGVALAKELGANNVRLSAVFQSEDERYFEGFYEEAAELCRVAKEEYDGDGFTVFNNFGRRLSDLQEKAPDYSLCGFHHLTTYIGGDQNMYRCCVTAYNELGLLGSLKDRRFKEAWFSADVQEKIQTFDARSCPRCMYNEQNRYINYAMQDRPAHSNFV